MATSNAASQSKNTARANQDSMLGQLYSGVNGFRGENELRDLQFRLANNLQSTLDVSHTLDLFYTNVRDLFRIESFEFINAEALSINFGDTATHSAVYRVASKTPSTGEPKIVSLGKIKITRDKPFLEAELAVIEMLIGVLSNPLRNALLYQEALQSSMRDPLTGVGNRLAMEKCFTRETKLALRHDMPLSLAIVDADHFKKLNDTYGHLNGDKVLKHIVKLIKESLRQTDQIFRFGGEEFAIFLHNTNKEYAKLTAERIRLLVALTPVELNGENVSATISIGVSELEQTDTTETFFNRADKALYQAKHKGRNKVVLSSV